MRWKIVALLFLGACGDAASEDALSMDSAGDGKADGVANSDSAGQLWLDRASGPISPALATNLMRSAFISYDIFLGAGEKVFVDFPAQYTQVTSSPSVSIRQGWQSIYYDVLSSTASRLSGTFTAPVDTVYNILVAKKNFPTNGVAAPGLTLSSQNNKQQDATMRQLASDTGPGFQFAGTGWADSVVEISTDALHQDFVDAYGTYAGMGELSQVWSVTKDSQAIGYVAKYAAAVVFFGVNGSALLSQ